MFEIDEGQANSTTQRMLKRATFEKSPCEEGAGLFPIVTHRLVKSLENL